jgi:hypothetical protein
MALRAELNDGRISSQVKGQVRSYVAICRMIQRDASISANKHKREMTRGDTRGTPGAKVPNCSAISKIHPDELLYSGSPGALRL